MTSFLMPNFQLMRDIVIYCLQLVIPKKLPAFPIQTPEQRLNFLQHVNILIREHFKLTINLKRLYVADIQAVGELQKISNQLVQYLNIDVCDHHQLQQDFTLIHEQVESLNYLRIKMINQGVKLMSLLNSQQYKEIYPSFTKLLSIYPSQQELKAVVDNKTQQIIESQIELQSQIQTNKIEQQRLQHIIEQQVQDLRFITERIETMAMRIPLFLQELNQNEKQLTKLYEQYVKKKQSLQYLNLQLDNLNNKQNQLKMQNQQERNELYQQQMKNKMKQLFNIKNQNVTEMQIEVKNKNSFIQNIKDENYQQEQHQISQKEESYYTYSYPEKVELNSMEKYEYEEYEEEASNELAIVSNKQTPKEENIKNQQQNIKKVNIIMENDLQDVDLQIKPVPTQPSPKNTAFSTSKTQSVTTQLSQSLNTVEKKLIEGINDLHQQDKEQQNLTHSNKETPPQNTENVFTASNMTPNTSRLSRRQNLRASSKLGSSRVSTKETQEFAQLSEGSSEYSYDLEEYSEDEKKSELEALPYNGSETYSES